MEMKEWECMYERILLDLEISREEKGDVPDEMQQLWVEFREKIAKTGEMQQPRAERDEACRKWENEHHANE